MREMKKQREEVTELVTLTCHGAPSSITPLSLAVAPTIIPPIHGEVQVLDLVSCNMHVSYINLTTLQIIDPSYISLGAGSVLNNTLGSIVIYSSFVVVSEGSSVVATNVTIIAEQIWFRYSSLLFSASGFLSTSSSVNIISSFVADSLSSSFSSPTLTRLYVATATFNMGSDGTSTVRCGRIEMKVTDGVIGGIVNAYESGVSWGGLCSDAVSEEVVQDKECKWFGPSDLMLEGLKGWKLQQLQSELSSLNSSGSAPAPPAPPSPLPPSPPFALRMSSTSTLFFSGSSVVTARSVSLSVLVPLSIWLVLFPLRDWDARLNKE